MSILLDDEESSIVFIDHPFSEMSVSISRISLRQKKLLFNCEFMKKDRLINRVKMKSNHNHLPQEIGHVDAK